MNRKKEYKHHSSRSLNASNVNQEANQVKWEYYWGLAIILLLSFTIYLPVFQNSLLDWDDNMYIKNNPLIHSFNLKEIFSQKVMGNYHPFTILILAIEYHFFGLNAMGYHAVNLVLHLLNVILVFFVVSQISRNGRIALVASLLFGIHPLHVESVAWASELKDLLYTFFFLASYIFYLKYLKDLEKKYYVYALLLFLISLLSKAMAASLPVVLILTDYFKGRKFNKNTILEKVPFFLLAIAFGIVAIVAQQTSGAISEIAKYTFLQRIIFASYGFVTYLLKLVMPLHLSAFYPYPIKGGEAIPAIYYFYVFCCICLAAFVIYSLRNNRKILFGVGFFATTVFLVLQLLPVGGAIMADRYSYLPSVGIFYLAGEGINVLWTKRQKWITIILLATFSIFFSVKTYARCGVWKNDLTLWNDVINQYQTIPYAYYNRGIIYVNEKMNDKALADFNKAIEIRPNYPDAYVNRGIIYMAENKNDMAFEDFKTAIELNPQHTKAYYNRGTLYMNVKKYDLALEDFNKVINLNSNSYEAFLNRGNIYIKEKKYEEAISNYKQALELKPDYGLAYYNKGLAEYDLGNKDAACTDLKQAASLGFKPASDILPQICK